MNLIPPALVDLASSKKAITFWVILVLWMPAISVPLGLSDHSLTWITIAFCAYVIAQGIADHGKKETTDK